MIVLVVPACDLLDSSAPEGRNVGPRILGISVDPPVLDIYYHREAAVTGLVAAIDTPAGYGGIRDAAMHWRVCDPWRPIPEDLTSCGANGSIPLEQDSDGTARLALESIVEAFPPPSEYRYLLDALEPPSQPPGNSCLEEYPHVEIPLVLNAEVDDTRLLALKWVRVTIDPNATWWRVLPRIEQLTFDSVPVEPGSTVLYAPGRAYRITATPAASIPCFISAQRLVRRIHIYATAGQLSAPYFDIDPNNAGDSSARSVAWFAPDEGERATLWLVVVDQDGGVAWGSLNLEPAESD